MDAVAELAVEQRLPYGGTVAARIIGTLMRDLGRGITSGESGQALLEANIPLLRGAGKVAYESRYQAERSLIYAARAFEQFRRAFLVEIASTYFELLRLKQEIKNSEASRDRFFEEWQRTQALVDAERILPFDAARAKTQWLVASNNVIDTQVAYDFAIDQFKIRLGMPTETPLEVTDVTEDELKLFRPAADEQTAIRTALGYRLDLLTSADLVDDAKRGVRVARNGLLPDLNLNGSVAMDTVPTELDWDCLTMTMSA